MLRLISRFPLEAVAPAIESVDLSGETVQDLFDMSTASNPTCSSTESSIQALRSILVSSVLLFIDCLNSSLSCSWSKHGGQPYSLSSFIAFHSIALCVHVSEQVLVATDTVLAFRSVMMVALGNCVLMNGADNDKKTLTYGCTLVPMGSVSQQLYR